MTWTDNAQKKVEILLAQIAGMSRLAAQLAPTASDEQVILPFKGIPPPTPHTNLSPNLPAYGFY